MFKHQFIVSAGMSMEKFWQLIDKFTPTNILKKVNNEFSLPELVFLYRAKFRKNLSFDAMASQLAAGKRSVMRAFWHMVFTYFDMTNCIPRMWVSHQDYL